MEGSVGAVKTMYVREMKEKERDYCSWADGKCMRKLAENWVCLSYLSTRALCVEQFWKESRVNYRVDYCSTLLLLVRWRNTEEMILYLRFAITSQWTNLALVLSINGWLAEEATGSIHGNKQTPSPGVLVTEWVLYDIIWITMLNCSQELFIALDCRRRVHIICFMDTFGTIPNVPWSSPRGTSSTLLILLPTGYIHSIYYIYCLL